MKKLDTFFVLSVAIVLLSLLTQCGCTHIKYGEVEYWHLFSNKSWSVKTPDIEIESKTNTDKVADAIGTLAETVQVLAVPK